MNGIYSQLPQSINALIHLLANRRKFMANLWGISPFAFMSPTTIAADVVKAGAVFVLERVVLPCANRISEQVFAGGRWIGRLKCRIDVCREQRPRRSRQHSTTTVPREARTMARHKITAANCLAPVAWGCALVLLTSVAAAGSLEKAKRMHDRLAGVPPSSAVLTTMQNKIDNGDEIGAAYDAMSNPAFYNARLKNWITPWTNRESNQFAPLNDYTATVIGLIRDEEDYRQVLYGDVLYVPSAGTYSTASNAVYVTAETNNVNLGDPAVLVKTTQSSKIPALAADPAKATAGIMTTRAAARAFFINGTNRAMFRFTLKNHLCNDMEQVQDITRPADRIRRDVPRSPGGDSRIFMNTCIGCHTGMDPMAQAFAYYDFQYDKDAADEEAAMSIGQLVYTAGSVQAKYDINHDHFAEGYITTSDRWDNYWRAGPDTAIFGWGAGPGGGNGAKSMGMELANSEVFAVCSVKKVFKLVCLREPSSADQSAFTTMLNSFKSTYNLKHTFAEAADYCSN
jgi:hypothetical protein